MIEVTLNFIKYILFKIINFIYIFATLGNFVILFKVRMKNINNDKKLIIYLDGPTFFYKDFKTHCGDDTGLPQIL